MIDCNISVWFYHNLIDSAVYKYVRIIGRDNGYDRYVFLCAVTPSQDFLCCGSLTQKAGNPGKRVQSEI